MNSQPSRRPRIALGQPCEAEPASPPATRSAPGGRAGSRARRRSAGTAADNASRTGRPSSSRGTPAGPRSGSASPTPAAARPSHTIVPAVHTCEKSVPSGRPLKSSVPCDGREQQRRSRPARRPGTRPRCGARARVKPCSVAESPPCVTLMPQKLNKSSCRRQCLVVAEAAPISPPKPQRCPDQQGRRTGQCKRARYGESDRDRPRHHQQLRRGHGGRQAQGHRELRKARAPRRRSSPSPRTASA